MSARIVQNSCPAKVGAMQSVWKRGFDVVLASVFLALFSPALLLIGLSIFFTSPGSVLYRQRRRGLRGRSFVMLKFRTMHSSKCAPQPLLHRGLLVKLERDPRVTLLGRFLRRFSLDELPQLWNVLRGDMSLVGPRPLPDRMLTADPGLLERRASVRPGMTGLWQIRARRLNRSIEDMLEHDLEYVRSHSITRDVQILLATVGVVLSGEGAV